MNNKVVCFFGHRDSWRNIGIEEKLKEIIEELIQKGYTIFYDGGKGYFDLISAQTVINLKEKYHNIKLIKVLTYYHSNNEKQELTLCYDESIYPELENCHPKQIYIKKNEWIVNNSNILVCHISNTYKSGAYRAVKYAQKINKSIIYI